MIPGVVVLLCVDIVVGPADVVDPADPSRSLEARPVDAGLVIAVAALAVFFVGVGLMVGAALVLWFAG